MVQIYCSKSASDLHLAFVPDLEQWKYSQIDIKTRTWKISAPALHRVHISTNIYICGILHYTQNIDVVTNFLHTVPNSLSVNIHWILQKLQYTGNDQNTFCILCRKFKTYYIPEVSTAFCIQSECSASGPLFCSRRFSESSPIFTIVTAFWNSGVLMASAAALGCSPRKPATGAKLIVSPNLKLLDCL